MENIIEMLKRDFREWEARERELLRERQVVFRFDL